MNPRDTFTRGSTRSKLFDMDYGEERCEQGQMKNTFKTNDSQQKIGVETNVITKQISETGTRILITNKTRQSIMPYQSRDLRIKHKPARVHKVEPKRGNF